MEENCRNRLDAILWTALGPNVQEFLSDKHVTEIRINSDGKLWKNVLGEGKSFTGYTVSEERVRQAIYSVAYSVGTVCNEEKPHLAAELPGGEARFQGILPPIVHKPVIVIRKRARRIFTLEDLAAQGVLTAYQAQFLRDATLGRENIVISGGTDSGKTTFANAILHEMRSVNERIVILEDTQELQCDAEDVEYLRSKEECVSLRDLIRITLRLSPDRIIVGEVRGAEALEMLKSWNTGHGGGITTVHASSALKSLSRLEQLVEEAGVGRAKTLIADVVHIVVYLKKKNNKRVVEEIIRVNGLNDSGFDYSEVVG